MTNQNKYRIIAMAEKILLAWCSADDGDVIVTPNKRVSDAFTLAENFIAKCDEIEMNVIPDK